MENTLFYRTLLLVTTIRSLSLMVSATGKICAETVSVVSHCPIANEYHYIASQRCVGVCGDSEGRYKYHCMQDSSKTVFMEMCAIPKLLFDYCPQYDRVGQLIQIDISTYCNSSHIDGHYLSSDGFLCNPDKCLKLTSTNVHTSRTTLISVPTNEIIREIHQNWMSQNWYYVVLVVLFCGCAVFGILKIISKKRNRKQTKAPSSSIRIFLDRGLQASS